MPIVNQTSIVDKVFNYQPNTFWLSNKNAAHRNLVYLPEFKYQGMHRIFILQLDIIGVS